MKLLGIEAMQYKHYYQSRYEQLGTLGAEVFVLNGEGTDDFWPADRYRLAGSRHIEALCDQALAWHDEEHFDGVLTFSESAVVAVAAVAERLSLPGVGLEAALASRNKLLMRRSHERGGVPHPRFRFVTVIEEALDAAAEFGYPVILKPTLGGGSYFVFRADDPGELRQRFTQARDGIDRMAWYQMEAQGLDLGPHGLLVESYLDGDEYLIEALAWDGEVYLGSVVDRVTLGGATFDDDLHRAPTALAKEELAAVHAVVAAGARAQGLRRSVMHAEVRFHGGAPYLLEMAVRPGGGGLDHMARLSAGYDPIKALTDVSLGLPPQIRHYRPTDVHTAAMCLLCDAGRIADVNVPEEVQQDPRVFFLKVTARPGDVIQRPPEGNNILGFLGATGFSFEDALHSAVGLAARIQVAFHGVEETRPALVPAYSAPAPAGPTR